MEGGGRGGLKIGELQLRGVQSTSAVRVCTCTRIIINQEGRSKIISNTHSGYKGDLRASD